MKKSYLIAVLLLSLAFILSFYIDLSPKEKICLIEHKCNNVLASKYSEIFGIPLTKYALFFFPLAIISLIYFLIKEKRNFYLELFIHGLSIFALYFIFLQIFVLKQICPFCIVIDISVIISSFSILFERWKYYLEELKR
ncbi:MAG: vitamin K epoxide reductase family protein [Candidatus Pacearchaeota archaeon]